MTSSQDAYLGAIVPLSWLQKYESLAQTTGKSLEELAKDALGQYLTFCSVSPLNTQPLSQDIIDLKQRVTELENSHIRLSQLSLNLQVLEHKINQLSLKETISQPRELSDISPENSLLEVKSLTHFSSLEVNSLINDDEDEPDEILWDFVQDS